MNLRWIMLFAMIAEEKSFTRAATRLNIAQPWLSAQIRKLEYQLGVQLLVRQSAGVTMTPEGEALLPYARQLSEAANMFRHMARTMGDAHSKTVRIGSHMPMIDIAALRPVNRDFARRHKNFSVNAEVGGTPGLLNRLHAAEFDFVVALSPLPEGRAEELETVKLAETRFCLLSSPAAPIEDENRLVGRAVGVPPADWHPELLARLFARLRDAGATTREVPEFDRRALEHLVTAHQMAVVTAIDEDDRAALDPRIVVTELPGISADHLLCRVEGRELGRAADHYWTLAQTRSRELEPVPA